MPQYRQFLTHTLLNSITPLRNTDRPKTLSRIWHALLSFLSAIRRLAERQGSQAAIRIDCGKCCDPIDLAEVVAR